MINEPNFSKVNDFMQEHPELDEVEVLLEFPDIPEEEMIRIFALLEACALVYEIDEMQGMPYSVQDVVQFALGEIGREDPDNEI